MTTTAPLPTRNEDRGFVGTITMVENPRPTPPRAGRRPSARSPKPPRPSPRRPAPPRQPRRPPLHPGVASGLVRNLWLAEAVDLATARWMGWHISRRTSRETGIPAGLATLAGFVLDAGIHAEAADD